MEGEVRGGRQLPCGLFDALPSARREALAARGHEHAFAAGECLCREDDEVAGVFCLRRGTVKLTRVGERGELQVIRLLGPGDLFGLRPILADERFAVTATALERGTARMVPRGAVLDALRDVPAFATTVLRHLARELRYSEDMLMALAQRPVRRRVADVLLLLHGHRVEDGSWDPFPPVPLQRREIAQMVNATPETVSRVLAEFAAREAIRLTRKDLTVLDPEFLRNVAARPPAARQADGDST